MKTLNLLPKVQPLSVQINSFHLKSVFGIFLLGVCGLFFPSVGAAFVLPLESVLHKTVANSGNQIFSVDQDVVFNLGAEELVVKENWLIEGDKNLRLTATGAGNAKDLISLSAIYNGKTKSFITGKNKISESANVDFFERYLSVRSVESFQKYLSELSIPLVIRLSRVAGVTAFAIGEPSAPTALRPQLWIDQDSFHVRKMRLPSGSEVQFDDFVTYGNIHYPKNKKVQWGPYTAVIKVRNVSTKTKSSLSSFYPQQLDRPSEMNLVSKGAMGSMVLDFYKRFR